jgi:hypothetical protein
MILTAFRALSFALDDVGWIVIVSPAEQATSTVKPLEAVGLVYLVDPLTFTAITSADEILPGLVADTCTMYVSLFGTISDISFNPDAALRYSNDWIAIITPNLQK